MSTDPFVVHVARLRRVSGSTMRAVRTGPVNPHEGAGAPRPGDSVIPDDAEVTCDVELQSFPGGVMVRGTVTGPWKGACRRCTGPVEGELRVSVRERFVDTETLALGGDEEAYPIVEDRLDLEPLVHDVVVLELPVAPLCAEDCPGLCPWCGADRNQEECGCVPPVDPRWASLDVLRSAPLEAPAPAHDRG